MTNEKREHRRFDPAKKPEKETFYFFDSASRRLMMCRGRAEAGPIRGGRELLLHLVFTTETSWIATTKAHWQLLRGQDYETVNNRAVLAELVPSRPTYPSTVARFVPNYWNRYRLPPANNY